MDIRFLRKGFIGEILPLTPGSESGFTEFSGLKRKVLGLDIMFIHRGILLYKLTGA
jgi:hypothetical protein